jgi:transcriptional regulator with XRE-family HTH domain
METIMATKQRINRFAGQKLYALRHALGISQATLGKELGVSGQQIQKYEQGVNCLSIDKLQRLAELFEVSTIVFFPAENANHPYEALPPASTRLIKLLNKISEEHHESLYAILRELLRIIQKGDAAEQKP